MRGVWILALVGCSGGGSDIDTPTEPVPMGLPVLGGGTHDVSSMIEVVGKRRDGLSRPTDLGFNPDVEGELWVVNKDDDSTTIYDDAGGAGQQSDHIVDPYALHFMEKVTSMAFGAPGTFATCQDGTNTYNDQAEGNNFTGPTLWSSDREIFGITNPEAVDYLTDLFGFPVNLGSHLDMLHESPECMGIAWDRDNAYFVFDGYNQQIVRYDFQQDHGVGYDDHSDGIISRWVDTDVKRKAKSVSHMELDHATGLLYVADTGNNRIMVLDTNSGSRGDSLPSRDCWQEPGAGVTCADHHEWVGGDWSLLVDGEALGMEMPAGLALVDDLILVTDFGTGYVHAFDLEGNQVDWADTGVGPEALAGIHARSIDDLWIVDGAGDQVLRLQSP